MKYFAGVALAILGAILVGCSGNGSTDHDSHDHGSSESSHSDEHGMHHDGETADVDMAVGGNTTCPVMEGDAIDPEVFTVYQGKKVYFCCDGCIDDFEKDPGKYFAKAYPEAK